jgi:hypothetical protein
VSSNTSSSQNRKLQQQYRPVYGFGAGRIPDAPADVYTNATHFARYNIWAAQNPDKAFQIPSYFGRLPRPVMPIRLCARLTDVVTTGKTMIIVPTTCLYDNTTTKLHAFAWRTDTTATDQSAAAPNYVPYNYSIEDVAPVYNPLTYICSTGKIAVNVTRGSAMDEPPTIRVVSAATAAGSYQDHPSISDDADTYYTEQPIMDYALSDSHDMVNNSHGHEMDNLQPTTGLHAVMYLPGVINGRGTMKFLTPQNAGASTWAQILNQYEGKRNGLIIITNTSPNSITVNVTMIRNIFACPTEQAIQSGTVVPVREAPFQMPLACVTAVHSGGAGLAVSDAHISALDKMASHVHADDQFKMILPISKKRASDLRDHTPTVVPNQPHPNAVTNILNHVVDNMSNSLMQSDKVQDWVSKKADSFLSVVGRGLEKGVEKFGSWAWKGIESGGAKLLSHLFG